MKNQTLKKFLALISLSTIILYSLKDSYVYHPNYEIIEDNLAYAKYANGLIYIGDLSFLSDISDLITENDIIILDERTKIKDPSFKIMSSYKITDK